MDDFDNYLLQKSEEMDLQGISGEQLLKVESLVKHLEAVEGQDNSVCYYMMRVM